MWEIFVLWGLVTLPAVGNFIGAVGKLGIFIVVFGGLLAWALACEGRIETEERKIRAGSAKIIAVCLALVLVATLIPSKQSMAIIVGGKLAITAASSDTAKRLGESVQKILDEQLKQLSNSDN